MELLNFLLILAVYKYINPSVHAFPFILVGTLFYAIHYCLRYEIKDKTEEEDEKT